MTRAEFRCLGPLVLFAASGTGALQAQEVEPRAYWNIPVGVNLMVAGIAHSTGGLSTDASVPLTDARLKINSGAIAYVRALNLWGRSGRLDLLLPYASLSGRATLLGQPVGREVEGLLDPRLRASINFYGAPALGLAEFAGYKQNLVVGGSVQITMPFGQYDPSRAINLGTNRWSVKSELGLSKSFGVWSVDTAAAVIFYEPNDSYFGGRSLQQAPIYSLQANVSRSFGSGVWAALGATHYRGGRTTLDGVQRDDGLNSSRIGATLSVPFARNHSIKLTASTGISLRTGTDFDTVGVFWQYRWAPL